MDKTQFKLEMLSLDEAIAATEKTLNQLKLIREKKLQKQHPGYVCNVETGEITPLIQGVPDLEAMEFIADSHEEFCGELIKKGMEE
ncbi:MAG: hypothetical protein WCV67_03035 [Victivallaceae bacterium]|jgi:hypothetical protein